MYDAPDPLAPTVVILSAGLGARFGGDKPFAAAGPHDEPLLAYALHDARKAGAGDAVLVVREADAARIEQLTDALLSRILPVRLAVQRIDDCVTIDEASFALIAADRRTPWGTGHAVLAARGQVARAAVVLNGDDFYGADAVAAAVDFARALEGRRRDGKGLRPTAALIGYPVAGTTSPRGGVNRALVTMAPDGRVTALNEVQDIRDDGSGTLTGQEHGQSVQLSSDAMASMNCWALPHASFDLLAEEFAAFVEGGAKGEFQLPTAITALVARNALRVMMRRTSGPWFGLTHPDDLAEVRAHLAALTADQTYPAPLVS